MICCKKLCNLNEIIKSNQEWSNKIIQERKSFFEDLTEGQSPNFLWIGCSDSRVSPSEITCSSAGSLFVHRNIGNLVSTKDNNLASTIYYAVEVLQVDSILLCGHTFCGAIGASMSENKIPFLEPWLEPLRKLYRKNKTVLNQFEKREQKDKEFARINIKDQMKNLLEFDFVSKRVTDKNLVINGLLYDLSKGKLEKI